MVRNVTFNFINIFLILLVSIQYTFCQHDEELFLQANKAYRAKEYQKSLNDYTAIKQKGAAVYYNMGLCYVRLENTPKALTYFLRAKKEAPIMFRNKVEELFTVLERNHQITTKQRIMYYFDYCNDRIPFSMFQFLLIVFWYALFFVWYRRSRKFIQASLLCCTVLCLFFVGQTYYERMHPLAVVMHGTRLHMGPSEHYAVLEEVKPTANVCILAEDECNWCKVQYANIIGWIDKEAIEKI